MEEQVKEVVEEVEVQNTFNLDSIEELNEEDVVIENKCESEVE